MRHMRIAAAAVALLLAAGSVLPVSAADTEESVTPECQKTLYYSVGTLNVHFDRNFNGANISVYRTQEEGEFPYYSYDVRLMDFTLMSCELIEGEYQLEVTVPSASGTEYISFPPFSFTIKDPDMDKAQSFDATVVEYYLSSDPAAAENVSEQNASVLENRIIREECHFTAAGLQYLAGDMNKDGSVNASDAACILIASAAIGAGTDSGLSAMETVEGDLTGDGILNASDSAVLLQYSADHATNSFTGDALSYARIRAGKEKLTVS